MCACVCVCNLQSHLCIYIIYMLSLITLTWVYLTDFFCVLGFNNMSNLVGHFMSSPRERKKRDRKDSRGDEKEGYERNKKMNENEETE